MLLLHVYSVRPDILFVTWHLLTTKGEGKAGIKGCTIYMITMVQ